MRKFGVICCVLGLCACDKHDPILPGVRTAIFDGAEINIKNQQITDIPDSVITHDNTNCPYTQDKNNVIWNGEKKIFSGFPTANSVMGDVRPVCNGKYIYAGLTTGEVIKINPKNRQIMWIADIYRASNLTGGASMVDIVAPVVPHGSYVYAGGLGDAFCKLNANNGNKVWCVDISVPVPFIITEKYAFVVTADKHLYAISAKNGDIYWATEIKTHATPKYENGIISVAKQKINVADGKIIK